MVEVGRTGLPRDTPQGAALLVAITRLAAALGETGDIVAGKGRPIPVAGPPTSDAVLVLTLPVIRVALPTRPGGVVGRRLARPVGLFPLATGLGLGGRTRPFP